MEQQKQSVLCLESNRKWLHVLRSSYVLLKGLERVANQNPLQPDLQYEFVSELAKVYPDVAIERYMMHDYVMDERLAFVYLNAMRTTSDYSYFNMDKFLQRLTPMDPFREGGPH
jgi:hypothetical protein